MSSATVNYGFLVAFSVADARRLASERGGVRIYMDKFRVFPYGDPGDDWLGLDADRGRRLTALPAELADKAEDLIRPMLLVPGSNQLFGAIFLSREHTKNVELNISRERLLENDAYWELVKFARLGIDWMTVEYAKVEGGGGRTCCRTGSSNPGRSCS